MVNQGNHPQMALIQVSELYYNLPRQMDCCILTWLFLEMNLCKCGWLHGVQSSGENPPPQIDVLRGDVRTMVQIRWS